VALGAGDEVAGPRSIRARWAQAAVPPLRRPAAICSVVAFGVNRAIVTSAARGHRAAAVAHQAIDASRQRAICARVHAGFYFLLEHDSERLNR
jgi:hypothetical protein